MHARQKIKPRILKIQGFIALFHTYIFFHPDFTVGTGISDLQITGSAILSFEDRKKKAGKGASKKDVNNYLRKQAKEANEPLNNAFAEAFSKIQL